MSGTFQAQRQAADSKDGFKKNDAKKNQSTPYLQLYRSYGGGIRPRARRDRNSRFGC